MNEKRPLQQLAELGQSVWIDYLSRDLLESGELARLVREDAVVGVTSNPAIFEKAIAHGDAYDQQLRDLLPRELNAKEIFLELACADVTAACDLLAPGLGADRRPRRLRLDRGRPQPRPRRAWRSTRRPGSCTSRSLARTSSSRSRRHGPA